MRALFVLMLFVPRLLLAEPCRESYGLRLGEAARCEGVLAPQSWIVDCLKCRKVDIPRLVVEHEHALATCATERLALEGQLEAMSALAQTRHELMVRAMERSTSPAWPWVAAGVGLVLGALGTWAVMR